VVVLPGRVNGVAYLTGAENSSVFLPLSYSQECGRGGCSTWTDGTLASGASVSWPRQVPLGREFPVREPVWDWGFGAELINDDGSAIASVVLGCWSTVSGCSCRYSWSSWRTAGGDPWGGTLGLRAANSRPGRATDQAPRVRHGGASDDCAPQPLRPSSASGARSRRGGASGRVRAAVPLLREAEGLVQDPGWRYPVGAWRELGGQGPVADRDGMSRPRSRRCRRPGPAAGPGSCM
jgi:hypothetical protein